MPITELYQIAYETQGGNIPTNGLIMVNLNNIVKSARDLIKKKFYKPKSIKIFLGNDQVTIMSLPRDIQEELYVKPIQKQFETRD